MRFLLVEDDKKLSSHLTESLRDHGFLALELNSAEELKDALGAPLKVDFVILDRLLGSADSKTYLPQVRRKWPTAPILILSAISTPNERTDLLNLGADDYLGKPFSTQELIARIRALLRRSSVPTGNFLQIGNLTIDSIKRVIAVGDRAETLPTREFSLLRTLAMDPARVWSKDDLLDYVWGQSTSVETNVVESTIANVRKKLLELGASVCIRNMRNAGYWIESERDPRGSVLEE